MSETCFDYPFQIRLADTDAAGVLFFAQLLRYAHDAYEDCMRDIGYPLPDLLKHGPHLPLVHARADYLAPLRHGERGDIRVSCEKIGRGSFTLGYRFVRGDGRLCARARTVHAAVDPAAAHAVTLPDGLLRALRALPRSGH